MVDAQIIDDGRDAVGFARERYRAIVLGLRSDSPADGDGGAAGGDVDPARLDAIVQRHLRLDLGRLAAFRDRLLELLACDGGLFPELGAALARFGCIDRAAGRGWPIASPGP